ncbi:hypothetical protein H2199_008360 [Coniosporium tulheliwenetii]|uniref:Uncharacterized protein n=1 Tax=Coniosporium tulheliwenetii TaxID=3383036 RepID=A0ACC2YJU5_9PEZI|nr:hypothetical protein H2199_008360 [Cladosporium sp. JES 115]
MALLILFSLAVLYCLYSSITSYLSERRFRAFALAHGCEPPPTRPPNSPSASTSSGRHGLDLLDDLIMARYRSMGRNTFTSTALGTTVLSTVEPANLQAILATKFKDFEIGPRRHKQFGILLGRNIFTSDGPFWEHSRAMFRPQFAREQINDLDSTEKATQALFQVIPVGEDGWTKETDLMTLFFRFTLDTATEFLFGESVDSQLAAVENVAASGHRAMAAEKAGGDVGFAEAFDIAQNWMGLRVRALGLYWLVDSVKLRKSVKLIREFTDYYVRLALEKKAQGGEKEKTLEEGERKKYVLVDALVNETRDSEELRDQMLGILLAGRDTTATLLSWVFIVLTKNPHIFNKLRSAILSDFGPTPSPSRPITFASLKSCKYLQHVLHETLRLHPSVPLNNRVAARDTVLPVGGGPDGTKPVAMRKGEMVNFTPYILHRRRDLWGEDVEEFRPERWEGRRIDWSFLPFSGGPRICLGQQYALTEAGYLIVRMLQRFDRIEGVGEHWQKKPRKKISLTMYPLDGVKVRLRMAREV